MDFFLVQMVGMAFQSGALHATSARYWSGLPLVRPWLIPQESMHGKPALG